MKQETRRGLKKIALALALAGYCAVPAIAANESGGNLKSGQWVILSDSTGTLQGTVPWVNRSATETTATDKDHVTVTIDRGSRTATTDFDKQFHIDDTVTVNWAIGDTEGDADNGTNNTGTVNDLTKATIVWTRSDSQDGTPVEISGTTGQTSYKITAADADKYIGIKITPTTSTGDPNVGTQIILKDLSTNAGGGSDSDDIPEGPVVDDKLNVVIYKDGTSTNLLGTSTKIDVNSTYKVLLWSDKNGDGQYTSDENVTADYNYRWKFTGTSAQLHTEGGIVKDTYNNQDLVIPVTNTEAKTNFDNASGGLTIGADGVQGYGLSIDYQRK
ncbi:TPA: SinI family autotransporter-associated protein [Escherichia coli]